MAKACARHILVPSEADCITLKNQIEAGSDFADVAKQHSKCHSGKEGGDLGQLQEKKDRGEAMKVMCAGAPVVIKSLHDAGKIDGANSLQRLWYIILPQSRHALVAVSIFHFLYAWNDFYEPLIFLHTRTNWTMAVGLQTFNAMHSVNTHLIMAASLMMAQWS